MIPVPPSQPINYANNDYRVPLNNEFREPVNPDYRMPVNADYRMPLHNNFSEPVNTYYSAPINTDYRTPLNADYRVPINNDHRPPIVYEYRVPINPDPRQIIVCDNHVNQPRVPLNRPVARTVRDGDYYLGVFLGFIFSLFAFIFFICKSEVSFRRGVCNGFIIHLAVTIIFVIVNNRRY